MARSTRAEMLNGILTALSRAWDAGVDGAADRQHRVEAVETADTLETLWFALQPGNARALAEVVKGVRKAQARLPAAAPMTEQDSQSLPADIRERYAALRARLEELSAAGGVAAAPPQAATKTVHALICTPPGATPKRLAEELVGAAALRDTPTRGTATGGIYDRGVHERLVAELSSKLKRYVTVGTRVFIPPEKNERGVRGVVHRPGASPRKRQPLCRCAGCVAERIVSTAETALDVKLTPERRGRPAKK